MKFTILAAFACLGAAHAAVAELPPTDAVAVDPDVHRVVLENDYIRVFDARASRGTKSPPHTHPPMVLIFLDRARARISQAGAAPTLLDLNPGQAVWVDGANHSWELLAGELHAIGVEIKSAQTGEAPPAPQRKADDVVAADPEAHHVLFENPHVRVIGGRTSHGRSSPMHSHPATALVSLDWLRLKLTLADGKTAIHDFSPGQVLWLEQGGAHAWEAIAGSGRVFAIEVKSVPAPAAKM